MEPKSLRELIEQAAKGRGCWIGLFSSRPVVVAFGPHYENSDPHMTLVHLGRKVTESQMRELHAAAIATADNSFTIEAKTHGYARFKGGRDGDPLVQLLRGEQLQSTHDLLVRQLRQRNIGYDDRFGFLPHVTVARGIGDVIIPAPDPFVWTFDRITLVCGDVRCAFEMKPPPF